VRAIRRKTDNCHENCQTDIRNDGTTYVIKKYTKKFRFKDLMRAMRFSERPFTKSMSFKSQIFERYLSLAIGDKHERSYNRTIAARI